MENDVADPELVQDLCSFSVLRAQAALRPGYVDHDLISCWTHWNSDIQAAPQIRNPKMKERGRKSPPRSRQVQFVAASRGFPLPSLISEDHIFSMLVTTFAGIGT